jgi:hypothetical protein
MIRPTKKLHLQSESIRVLTTTALRQVQGGVMVEKCTKDYSGCNPGGTSVDCDSKYRCNDTYKCDTTTV